MIYTNVADNKLTGYLSKKFISSKSIIGQKIILSFIFHMNFRKEKFFSILVLTLNYQLKLFL